MRSNMTRAGGWVRGWFRVLWVAWVPLVPVGSAQGAERAPEVRHAIHQPSQPLAASLAAIAKQTGVSLLFDPAALDGRMGRPISGQLTAAEAVARVLDGTGLVVVESAGALVVRSATVAAPASPPAPPAAAPAGNPPSAPQQPRPSSAADGIGEGVTRLAQAAAPASDAASGGPAAAERAGEKVEVTGTRLRREPGQQLAFGDHLAGRAEVTGDDAVGRGADFVLHLHRLQNQQRLADTHRRTDFDQPGHELRLQRRVDGKHRAIVLQRLRAPTSNRRHRARAPLCSGLRRMAGSTRCPPPAPADFPGMYR